MPHPSESHPRPEQAQATAVASTSTHRDVPAPRVMPAGTPDVARLLIESFGVDRDAVTDALADCDHDGEVFDVLSHRGILTQAEVAAAQALRHGLAIIDLRTSAAFDVTSTPLSLAEWRSLGSVPLSVDADTLVVATYAPETVLNSDLASRIGRRVILRVALHDEVTSLLDHADAAAQLGSAVVSDPVARLMSDAARSGASRVHLRLEDGAAGSVRYFVGGEWSAARQLTVDLSGQLNDLVGTLAPWVSSDRGGIGILDLPTGSGVTSSLVTSLHGRHDLVFGIRSADVTIERLGLDARALAEFQRHLDARSGLVVITGPTDAELPSVIDAVIGELDHEGRLVMCISAYESGRIDGAVNIRAIHEPDVLRTIDHARVSGADVVVSCEVLTSSVVKSLLECAADGRLVVLSFHSAQATPGRAALARFGVTPDDLAGLDLAILNVRQVRRACAGCAVPHQPDDSVLSEWVALGGSIDVTFVHGFGCALCGDTGFVDRTFVAEVSIARPHQHVTLLTDSLVASARGLVEQQATSVGEVVRRLALVGEQAS